MHNFTLFASANSRLQTDIILIRLRRAEIKCRAISVLCPSHSFPNAMGCWRPIARQSKLMADETSITCAGQLGKQAHAAAKMAPSGQGIFNLLTHAGVDVMGARALIERLKEGHNLLGVTAKTEKEATIAWYVFRHAGAETIIVNGFSRRGTVEYPRVVQSLTPWVTAAA